MKRKKKRRLPAAVALDKRKRSTGFSFTRIFMRRLRDQHKYRDKK